MAKTIPNEEKVFLVSKSTNTTYSGSAALKAMSEWYTMEDVSNTVKPYKVFTALLTQSGGDATGYITSTTIAPFVIGVTYEIAVNSGNADFTNIGAPNNNIDTRFIATGTTPNSWGDGEYVEIFYNTGAPVATVLENTIGNVWFTYLSNGEYYANSVELFTENKTATFGGWYEPNYGVGFVFNKTSLGSNSIIYMATIDGVPTNGYLQDTTIEIRVYN